MLKTTQQNQKRHYRMYKAGKQWLFAAVVTFAFGGAMLQRSTVQADSTTTNQVNTIRTDTATATNEGSSASSGTASTAATSAISASSKSTTSVNNSTDNATKTSNTNSDASVSVTVTVKESVASNASDTNSATSASSTSAASESVASQSQTGTANDTSTTSTAIGSDTASVSNSQSSATSTENSDATSVTSELNNTNTTTSTNQSTASMTVTSLSNNATEATVSAAKAQAESAYASTGTAQEIVRMDAANTGTGYDEGQQIELLLIGQYNTDELYKQGSYVDDQQSTFTSPVYTLTGSYSEATTAADGVLGVTNHFTVFTFDSLTASNLSGTQRIAVGGNLILTGSAAANLAKYGSDPQIIVGGTEVVLDNSTPTTGGKIYVNTDSTVWSNAWAKLNIYKINTTDFFTAAKIALTNESNTLSQLAQTVGAKVIVPNASNPNLTLQGVDGADEDVFVLNSSDIPNASNYGSGGINITNVTNSTGGTAKVIINVVGDSVLLSGTSITINGQTMTTTQAANVVWNMPDVVSLVTNQAAIAGNVLAPNATFYTNGQSSNTGNIAVNSYAYGDLNSFTVKYVDENNNQIHQSMTWAVNNTDSGKTKTVSPILIDGYTLSGMPTVSNPNVDVINGKDNVTVSYSSGVTGNTITYHYTKNAVITKGTVTANYVDANGNTLADSTSTTGTTGTTYTVNAPTITGYSVSGDGTQSGTYTDGTQKITFSYVPNNESAKIHYYVTGTTTSLLADGKTTGNYGTSTTVTAPNVTGYQLVSNSATVNFSENTPDVTFYYSPIVGGKVTVVAKGTGLALPMDVLSGNEGRAYTTVAPTVSGYTWDGKTPANATGVFTDTPQQVTYNYTRNTVPVTVKYINLDTQVLLDTTELLGSYGDSVEADAKEYDNLTLLGVTTQTATVTDKPQTMEFLYTSDPKTVTTNYVTTDNKGQVTSLAPSATQTVAYDDQYTMTPKTITGYYVTLDSVPSNASGSWSSLTSDGGSAANHVTFNYVPDPVALTITYKDVNGNDLSALTPADIGGDAHYGMAYKISAATIAGYTLTAMPTNASGTLPDHNVEINFVYAKDATVTTHYVDEAGTAVSVPNVQTVAYNGRYATTAPLLAGYTLKTTPANASGAYQNGDPILVKYVYTKKVVASEVASQTSEGSQSTSLTTGSVASNAPSQANSTGSVDSETSNTPSQGNESAGSQTSQASQMSTGSLTGSAASVTGEPISQGNSDQTSEQVSYGSTGTTSSVQTVPSQASEVNRQVASNAPVPTIVPVEITQRPSTSASHDDRPWDPIKLILLDEGGHTIATTEIEGYTDDWYYIGNLIPTGYHLAPSQSAWVLLNNVTPQTIQLIADSRNGGQTDSRAVSLVSFKTQTGSQTQVTSMTTMAAVSVNAATTSQPVASQAKKTTKELPHTNEDTTRGLQLVGAAILGFILAMFGWRRKPEEQ